MKRIYDENTQRILEGIHKNISAIREEVGERLEQALLANPGDREDLLHKYQWELNYKTAPYYKLQSNIIASAVPEKVTVGEE